MFSSLYLFNRSLLKASGRKKIFFMKKYTQRRNKDAVKTMPILSLTILTYKVSLASVKGVAITNPVVFSCLLSILKKPAQIKMIITIH